MPATTQASHWPRERRLLSAAGTFLVISRMHIVAIAALGGFTFGWALTGQRPWLAASVGALDWFLVNLLNRVVDLHEDRKNRIRGVAFVARHRRMLTATCLALLVCTLLGGLWILPALLPFRAGYHLLGLAYNWRLLPGGRRIKQLYFWKNTASATGFLITVFCYPLVVCWAGGGNLAPDVSWTTVAVSIVFFFFFELSYEIIYDLRDAPGDAAAGIRSYPVEHGPGVAARMVDALCLGSVAVLATGYAASVVPWRVLIMVFAPLLQLVVYRRALRHGGITSRDCIGLTWLGAGLLLTYHLWVVMGLPGASWP